MNEQNTPAWAAAMDLIKREATLSDEAIQIQEQQDLPDWSDTPLPEEDNETSPLAPPLLPSYTDGYHEGYQVAIEHGVQRATAMLAAAHHHRFTYALNQNHTLVAGCECGLCYGGLVAGHSDKLILHRIRFEDEE